MGSMSQCLLFNSWILFCTIRIYSFLPFSLISCEQVCFFLAMNGVSSSSTGGLRFVSCVLAPLGNRCDLAQDAQLPPSFFLMRLLPPVLSSRSHLPRLAMRNDGSPVPGRIESWDSVAVSVLMTCKLWRAHVSTFFISHQDIGGSTR